MRRYVIFIGFVAAVAGLFAVLFVAKTAGWIAAPTGAPATVATTETAGRAAELTETYDNPADGYTMKYPAGWTYQRTDKGLGMLVLRGADGTDASKTDVTIQDIAAPVAGDASSSVATIIDALKLRLQTDDPNMTIIDEQPLGYTTKTGETLEGDQILVRYVSDGTAFERWQIVIPRVGADEVFALSFTAPEDLFDATIATAQDMIDSWTMRE